MTDYKPLTGQELEEMKKRVQGWTEGGYILPSNIPKEEYHRLADAIQKGWEREVARHAVHDLPRCLAEIERLQDENEYLKGVIEDAYQAVELDEFSIAKQELYQVVRDL